MNGNRSCEGCMFWSELIARSIGGRPLEALCLNLVARNYGIYTHAGCDDFEAGPAIDDPDEGGGARR